MSLLKARNLEWQARRHGFILLIGTDGRLKVYPGHIADKHKALQEEIAQKAKDVKSWLQILAK